MTMFKKVYYIRKQPDGFYEVHRRFLFLFKNPVPASAFLTEQEAKYKVDRLIEEDNFNRKNRYIRYP